MTSFESAVKLLGVGLLASILSSGCILAKKVGGEEEMAAAPQEEQMVEEEPMNPNDMYTVVSGDCLWCISAKSQIYGDPYKWPLIYRTNVAQIGDADLIYPGQEFEIDRNASPELIANATEHARTRGAWTLGVPEANDIQFLADNP
ncbi:MAG: LysM peptidoglycan-binding domain-containing protein [Gammaproteobacteria bacterium]|nr:LysM peptidoglycan-binding domain-containing protein [Gammaproteobacteria bacterium]